MDSPISEVLELIRRRDFLAARARLGLGGVQMNDAQLLDTVQALRNAFELIDAGQHVQAYAHLRKALPVMKLSRDPEWNLMVKFFTLVCLGIQRLFQGDAHGAYLLLDRNADAMDKQSLLYPNLAMAALSVRAMATLALAKVELSRGNLAKAENLFGRMTQVHNRMLAGIDQNQAEAAPVLGEIYGTKLDVAVLFCQVDMAAMDFDAALRRIKAVEEARARMAELLPLLKDGTVKTVQGLLLSLVPVLGDLCALAKITVEQRRTLTKREVSRLRDIDNQLFVLRQMALNAADRGEGYLHALAQLDRLVEQLLRIGRAAGQKDFGRFGGVVSLAAFLVVHLAVYFTIQPSGIQAIWYFLGEVIVGLIVGFGYGALKFKPLLNLFADTIKAKSEREEKEEGALPA